MKLESNGILISLRPFDEKNAVAKIFTRDYGIIVGMMRGAVVAKSNKPLVGQIGTATWNARIDSALGVFHWDAEKNLAVPMMNDFQLLTFMNAAFDLIGICLPEREPYATLYDATLKLMTELPKSSQPQNDYLMWEMTLLREMGYALDLSRCSGCGAVSNLVYLSPKTGRAVCESCGAPYRERLYNLPITTDITLNFLEKICNDMGATVPHFRKIITTKKI